MLIEDDNQRAADEFAATFENIATEASTDPAPVDTSADPTPAAAEPAPPPVAEDPASADSAPAEPAPAEPAEPVAAEPAPAEPTPAEPVAAEPKPVVNAEDILNRLAERLETPQAPAAPAPAEPQEQPLYNDDEQAALTKFNEEFPEISHAFDLRSRAVGRAIIRHVFSEVEKELGPVRELAQAAAGRMHHIDIKEKVGDYSNDDIEAITSWAKEQPTYLQKAYLDVIQEGTADEVADLVTRYREAKGIQPAGAPADPAPRGEHELSEPAKQAAAGLAPVSSKRSVVRQSEDPNDFLGTFEKLTMGT